MMLTPDTSPHRRPFIKSEGSWTDDLPICQLSDVGVASNVQYSLHDGTVSEAYPYEDRAFNFATDYDCYLYGVFDGHDGSKAAHFAAERIPAELLLGQLSPDCCDDDVIKALEQAFQIVEHGFFESIDVELAKKTHLQSQLPERLPADLAEKHYPSVVQQINALNDAIKGGTTSVVAVVVNNKLYIANVGDSRALLCQLDAQRRLDVKQVTTNHDIYNDDELSRLRNLGLDIEKIIEKAQIGMNECTRCIGDYTVKGGYKENSLLKTAKGEPVTAQPDIIGGISLDQVKGGFLVLMSDDVYKSLEEATGTTNPNEDIARMISHEFQCKNHISGIAQNVINKISFLHHDSFGKTHNMDSRGDITLLVRNLNHPVGTDALPAINPPPMLPDLSGRHPVSIPYEEGLSFLPSPSSDFLPMNGKSPVTLSLVMPAPHNNNNTNSRIITVGGSRIMQPASASSSEGGLVSIAHRSGTSTSTSPSDDTPTNVPTNGMPPSHSDFYWQQDEQAATELDSKVAAYVDLSNFNENAWRKMKKTTSS